MGLDRSTLYNGSPAGAVRHPRAGASADIRRWIARRVRPVGLRPPLTLSGEYVRLIPMLPGHAARLARSGRDPSIWRFLPYGPCTTAASMRKLILRLRAREQDGTDLCFTVERRADGALVGMTRFLEIDRAHRRAEIGGTWYAVDAQRTACNTESKRLLLAHGFEEAGLRRIQFKTDLRNERSQRAIERLGAVREGILRDHMIMPDGYHRSSVVYSIVAPEWPAVRRRLDAMLHSRRLDTRSGRPRPPHDQARSRHGPRPAPALGKAPRRHDGGLSGPRAPAVDPNSG